MTVNKAKRAAEQAIEAMTRRRSEHEALGALVDMIADRIFERLRERAYELAQQVEKRKRKARK